jgi:hypothetical protein
MRRAAFARVEFVDGKSAVGSVVPYCDKLGLELC